MHYEPGDENLDLKSLIENDSLTRVGINTNEVPQLSTAIFPNPVNDKLLVTFSQMGQYKIRLFDLTGKVLLKTAAYTNKMVINVEAVLPGMYLLEIIDINSTETWVKKIIVSRD